MELAGKLAEALRNVVNRLHRVHVGLVDSEFQVLWQRLVSGLTIVQLHLFARSVRQRRLQEELDLATFSLDNRISLVKFDAFLEECVHFRSSLFLSEFFIEHKPCVLGDTPVF